MVNSLGGFEDLMARVRACDLCAAALPHGPRPVLQADPAARILIAGQAPGRKVHESGVPFDDASGDRLREWLGVDRDVFYNPTRIAILPMGFCYPGTGPSGDLPPRPECAPAWRDSLISRLSALELTVILGRHAMAYHFAGHSRSLTEQVASWRNSLPQLLVLPHPSPRNNRWLKKNPWFEAEVIPELQARVGAITSM